MTPVFFSKMEDIAFSDWPGQPVDLNSGNNPWLPAYGFQTPTALLEKEDFIGNPDAEYFLHGTAGHYMYLETILEETSDDLRSESDLDSRGSPVGWLATDSESGSVICMDNPDDFECDSDRELACPAKRRKQDLYLTLPSNADEDLNSLSRSSSLLQFETLEKQCQESCSSSPSIYSQFSFDSLEINGRKINLSPDSLNSPRSDDESDYYKSLKIAIPRKKENNSNDSLLYNATRYSGSDSSDSDVTLEASRSCDNLKTWRSFDSLPISANKGAKEKASVENLSEDSGYSDHLTKSSSANNLKEKADVKLKSMRSCPEKKNSYVGFAAYDGDVFQNFNGNFGVSYQDLSVFRDDHLDAVKTAPLLDAFIKTKKQQQQQINDTYNAAVTKILNIDTRQECDRQSNFKSTSCSEPNLLQTSSSKSTEPANAGTAFVSSVPKDLNFIGEFNGSCCSSGTNSIAVKDWNLADLQSVGYFQDNELDEDMGSYKREGSYTEAMSNRVDLSDDEHSLYNKKKPKLPKTPIVEFDKKVLKAISEQSLQSVVDSTHNLHLDDQFLDEAFTSTPISATEKRNVASTPNLTLSNQLDPISDYYFDPERRKSVQDIRRKGSIIKSSTSTSGMSDVDEKTVVTSVKSFCGSNNSKGVHFSPVVSEVNWRDDSVSTVTPDRESIYSFGSSSPERRVSPPKQIHKPKARLGTPARLSSSQPDLSDNDTCKREFEDSLKELRQDYSKSQPDISRIKRRGSQLIKKDKDGSLIKAYVDSDGIQYKHTHLDLGLGFGPHHQRQQQQQNNKQDVDDEDGGRGARPAAPPRQSAFRPVNAMEATDVRREVGHARGGADVKEKSKSGKLGGFFSRLASFRFSLKKGAEEKAKVKKKTVVNSDLKMVPQQRVATKADYIYIPLKGPPVNSTARGGAAAPSVPARSQSLTAKPPLPKQPPRVVHASVKRDGTTHAPPPSAAGVETRHRRRRTIDSADTQLPMEPMGLIETDLDTEVTVITSGANAKTRSLLNLGPEPRLALAPNDQSQGAGRPHKSMEFLLDKQNLKVVEPPENELQKGERVMSEHQLRVQRSLQKLTIPEWYKQSQVPQQGFLLKKHSPRETRWTGTGSKTTSLGSLGSNTQSPLVLSPTPCNQPFVRWSTSKLNSTASSPCASTRSSFNARQPNGSISPSSARSSFSYRQPYMGWRSQERLTRPRTPAERLASSLLSSHQNHSQPQESPEIQTSIKEVTSAIVHYVSGLKPEGGRDRSYESQETASQRSSSVSPRGSQKLCWLESSFVGTRPLDSPQTPVTLSENQSHNPVPPSSLRLDLQAHNDVTLLTTSGSTLKPSPSSTTLEDVLDSLLGLPSTGRAPSPSLQGTVSANTSPCRQGQDANPAEQFRRRSEGSEPASGCVAVAASRRVSFSSPVLRCRYSRCGRTALAAASEASSFKNCHNCSYTYCSRACRRAHWEKHRKTCLFSRIGTLCRQVIAAAKEQKDTLTHLSKIARRGYLSHGPGAVKCFYPNPEAAETFLSKGLQYLGELTYVRWQDLLPSEMGPQLYAELVKMCKSYNPDTKLVVYVSVCVVSETPAAGAVKWERQLVSRCAKMRLSKAVQVPEKEPLENPDTLVLTSTAFKAGSVDSVKKQRETAVQNLQDHLRSRGVSLKRQHPEIHKQLVAYCEDEGVKFTPVTVYPTDSVSGKSFMCIIMLEANQESLKKVESAGVRVRTVDLMKDPASVG